MSSTVRINYMGELPTVVIPGLQGICTASSYHGDVGIARAVVMVTNDNMIPVKVLNTADHDATLKQNRSLIYF